MTATFGPQLIGQTEKTLQALLRRALAGTGLDERQWVALRLADQPDGTGRAKAWLWVAATQFGASVSVQFPIPETSRRSAAWPSPTPSAPRATRW